MSEYLGDVQRYDAGADAGGERSFVSGLLVTGLL